MTKQFNAVKGSRLTDEQAQSYGERIETLVEDLGHVSRNDVLKDAECETSPLHDFFDWDDTTAAHKFRLNQAGYLLRTINVTVKSNGDEDDIRAFHVVTLTDTTQEQTRGYVTAVHVMSDAELRAQVIEEALKQLTAWRKKYRQYSELCSIFEVIDETLEMQG